MKLLSFYEGFLAASELIVCGQRCQLKGLTQLSIRFELR